jgi:hypothetical protein
MNQLTKNGYLFLAASRCLISLTVLQYTYNNFYTTIFRI